MSKPIRYSNDEVAEMLDVKPRTVSNWRHRGGGPHFIKIGRKVRYTPEAIDEYLAGRTYHQINKLVSNSTNQ